MDISTFMWECTYISDKDLSWLIVTQLIRISGLGGFVLKRVLIEFAKLNKSQIIFVY